MRNKHIIQLLACKNKKTTWGTCVNWLRALIKDFPSTESTVKWASKIGDNWSHLREKRRRLQSDKYKSEEGLVAFLEWEDSIYQLPSIRGPNKPKTAPPSISKFELDCAQTRIKFLEEENRTAKQEIQRLKDQNEVLKMRQSPHSQQNQNRREMPKNIQIKEFQSCQQTQERTVDKLVTKIDRLQKTKRKLSSAFSNTSEKLPRMEEDKEQYIFGLEDEIVQENEKTRELKEELLQCKEVNAILIDTALMWRTKLAEAENEELTLFQEGAFTSTTRKCVYELLGCNVSQEKIPSVIQSVLQLAEKKVDRIPSSGSVRNMNKEMVALCQFQLQELTNSKN